MPSPYISSSPPAPLSATRRRGSRRRHLLLLPFSAPASSSASSPASSTGLSLFSFSRSPSPFHHRFLSPLHAASAVPFAWEHRPGVPKTPARQTRSRSSRSTSAKAQTPPLPLPPSRLLLHQGSKVGADDDDYDFTIPNPNDDDCFIVPDEGAKERLGSRRGRRQPALAAATLTDCLAVLSLCQSCTRSRGCLAGTPPPRRPRVMASKAVAGWSSSGYY